MDANYITASASSAQAFKTATLLKTLSVNALITGEVGVGKRSLARYILPDAPMLDSSNYNEILKTLEGVNKIIITNLENSQNIKKIFDIATANNIRVIATANGSYYNEIVDKIFSIKLDIPSLSERPEDVKELIKKFVNEASLLFGQKDEFKVKNFKPDLSQNSNSLRKQVMINYLLQNIQENELIEIIENYLVDKLGSNNDYKNFLHLYEIPIIKAGLQRFKSQLQLSDKLGLNRNTLRKKIADNSKYL
ncbi:MAG: Fis family transcriptional regulator [Sulfurimonas sp. RIFCSPHIGHO2_12_FULL_36_9]|nr:MAG: Fis family transcriptional regulator [Sulfurimonas sp. RIFCSPHIGHO2_12_FULL_36_9]OHD98106.1 MAG: Fis family transcriptional regulator [Sulfurimonas sp. RIFCSPLOWO2_02_FULL_36_28]OHE02243.1 MAG: Fis family transcriptional regulator [Sulfurimonas sp. RIFCSPLOWO2_12_36_12]OHE03114.1 MAG: Fis family transcriptional regulator [Sulfurimonas sp. RIFCSPLOWO2_12_FULL_36_74]